MFCLVGRQINAINLGHTSKWHLLTDSLCTCFVQDVRMSTGWRNGVRSLDLFQIFNDVNRTIHLQNIIEVATKRTFSVSMILGHCWPAFAWYHRNLMFAGSTLLYFRIDHNTI